MRHNQPNPPMKLRDTYCPLLQLCFLHNWWLSLFHDLAWVELGLTEKRFRISRNLFSEEGTDFATCKAKNMDLQPRSKCNFKFPPAWVSMIIQEKYIQPYTRYDWSRSSLTVSKWLEPFPRRAGCFRSLCINFVAFISWTRILFRYCMKVVEKSHGF